MGADSFWTLLVGGGGGLLTFGGIVLTTRLARKSQKESNVINGATAAATAEDLKFKQYRDLFNEVQEERAAAIERANNADSRAERLVEKVEIMDKFMREHFAGYRGYIHTLRGQVFDLGGTPQPWPDNLEQ